MKYRKKPIEVSAFKFTGDFIGLMEWTDQFADEIRWILVGGKYPHINIPTKEGEMRADLGDWIIREPFATDDRKYYPCKPDIFEQTYERVQD